MLEHVGDFRSIDRFRLEPAIFLTLKGDISRPEGVTWECAAVGLVVLNARAARQAQHHEETSEIAIHGPLPLEAKRIRISYRAFVSEGLMGVQLRMG